MPIATAASRDGGADYEALDELVQRIAARHADAPLRERGAGEEFWTELVASDIAGLSLPERVGGYGTVAELCVAAEAFGKQGLPSAGLIVNTAVVGRLLADVGTEPCHDEWLKGMVAGDVRFCFALTEADSGSNPMRMRTTVRQVDDGWVVSGEKTYISAVDVSTHVAVIAREPSSNRLVPVVIDLEDEGVSWTRVNVDVAVPERQWTVHFDDVMVPAGHLVGGLDNGWAGILSGLNSERLVAAAQALGLGRWCMDRALEYARTRTVFGAPIGAHQAVQHPLAEAYIALEGASSLLWRAIDAFADGSPDLGTACSTAKVAACDAGLRAADAALQTFGGSGFTRETQMFEMFGFLRLLKSIPISRELALNHIASSALALPKSY